MMMFISNSEYTHMEKLVDFIIINYLLFNAIKLNTKIWFV